MHAQLWESMINAKLEATAEMGASEDGGYTVHTASIEFSLSAVYTVSYVTVCSLLVVYTVCQLVQHVVLF